MQSSGTWAAVAPVGVIAALRPRLGVKASQSRTLLRYVVSSSAPLEIPALAYSAPRPAAKAADVFQSSESPEENLLSPVSSGSPSPKKEEDEIAAEPENLLYRASRSIRPDAVSDSSSPKKSSEEMPFLLANFATVSASDADWARAGASIGAGVGFAGLATGAEEAAGGGGGAGLLASCSSSSKSKSNSISFARCLDPAKPDGFTAAAAAAAGEGGATTSAVLLRRTTLAGAVAAALGVNTGAGAAGELFTTAGADLAVVTLPAEGGPAKAKSVASSMGSAFATGACVTPLQATFSLRHSSFVSLSSCCLYRCATLEL
mmetsp:Transcript_4478/g.13137  ORF Transcript_4478/g.13137 Transcript_4478/m.13137 type:complete len:318 (+) Transcript_4478:140-1093(+)